jgi:hypothetical protein
MRLSPDSGFDRGNDRSTQGTARLQADELAAGAKDVVSPDPLFGE